MDKVCFALVALFVLVFGAISNRLSRTIFTAPMAFVLFGLFISRLFPAFFAGAEPRAVVHTVCEFTLIVLLFTDSSRMDVRRVWREHNVPLRLLFIGLPLAVMAGALAARIFFPQIGIWDVWPWRWYSPRPTRRWRPMWSRIRASRLASARR